MEAQLRIPFRSLSAEDLLSRGSAGQIFAISKRVVLKCPTSFDHPATQQVEEMKESFAKIEREKAIYSMLMQRPHPHIIDGILCIPEGIFLRRAESTMEVRLGQADRSPVSPNLQIRWIRQLANALTWLECLDYVHGDLRPSNILLDRDEQVKLSDFDASVRRGEELVVTSEPFCKLNENYESPLAGAVTEQFSLGSCIYNIRFGCKPFHDLDPPVRVQRLIRNIFPTTSTDNLFGDLISECWLGRFPSLIAVEKVITTVLQTHVEADHAGNYSSLESPNMLLKDCWSFLESEEWQPRNLANGEASKQDKDLENSIVSPEQMHHSIQHGQTCHQ